MKNTLKILCLSLFFLSFQFANAQENTKIGGVLAYGTEIENLGIGINAEFPILEKLTISPSFIYYLPKEEAPIKINWWELNGNANYYLVQDPGFQVYGLAGLNYTSVKVKYDGPTGSPYGGDFSGSDGRVGLNLGAGANLDLGSTITPFAELKYVIIDNGQLVLAAGVKFDI